MKHDSEKRPEATREFLGLNASPGIAQGPAYVLDRAQPQIRKYSLLGQYVEREQQRFERAIVESRDQLQALRDRLAQDVGPEHLYILDSHLLLLQDELLINDTIETIKRMEINAEWALKRSIERFQAIFNSFDDEYLRARQVDLQHIGSRILRNLTGQELDEMADEDEPVIIVAHDLSPDDTMQLTGRNVLGFATEIGGYTSHTSIMARSLEIPAVVGVHNLLREVHTGDYLIIDGQNGTIVVHPTEKQQADSRAKRQQYLQHEEELLSLTDLPSVTADGRRIRLDGNIEYADEVSPLRIHGAEGIGLYRTEYLCMNRTSFPSEEEQFQAYQNVAKRMSPNWVVIRTFDLGGDKFLSHTHVMPASRSGSGLRAMRFCLKHPDLFKTQLRALLRASSEGNIRLLYPLITTLEEVRAANALLDEARDELRRGGHSFDEHLQVGVMIETPAAVGIAELLAKEVKFFSIGTNDLIQYAMAIDRVNEELAEYYDPLHPYILRSVQRVIQVGRDAGIWTGICGEMAADPESIPLLVGMHVDELSVNPIAIPHVKQIIRGLTYKDCIELANEALKLDNATAARDLVQATLESIFDCND